MKARVGQIAIAGGGIGGLALAVGLQHRGLDVVVFERQTEIRDTGAGISLWPNALAALDALDLGGLVRDLGQSLSRGGHRSVDGREGFAFSTEVFISSLGEGLVCVDRGRLVRALAALLAPGTVRIGAAVTGYRRGSHSVVAQVDGADDVEVAALIGADGISSAVASQMNGALQLAYSGYTAWRGIASMQFEPDRDQIRACIAEGHEVGWLPVDAERTYWFATAWLPQRHELPVSDEEYLTELFAGWPQPIGCLLRSTARDGLVRNDIFDRAPLRRWCDGPVAILGDAAHPMRPHLGQGGCQALEDAAALVRLLDGSDDFGESFRRYERARRRRAEMVVRLSKRAGFTRPPGRATQLLDRFTAAMPAVPMGAMIRALKPIAGYSAGTRGTNVTKSATR